MLPALIRGGIVGGRGDLAIKFRYFLLHVVFHRERPYSYRFQNWLGERPGPGPHHHDHRGTTSGTIGCRGSDAGTIQARSRLRQAAFVSWSRGLVWFG